MVATTMQRTRRPADTAKWAGLFGKAVREGVEVRQTGSGAWIATSGTDRRAAYVVNLGECECPGHTYHGYCKHRAMLAWTLGVLVLGGDTSPERAPDPEPPTPAAPAYRFGCGGKGYHADPDGRSAPERCPCREALAA